MEYTRLAVIEQSVNGLQSRKSESRQSVDRFVSQQQEVQAKLGETGTLLKELDEEKSILPRTRRRDAETKSKNCASRSNPLKRIWRPPNRKRRACRQWKTRRKRTWPRRNARWGRMQWILVEREEGLDNLREKIADDFGLVSFEYAANIEGPVPLPFEGLVEQLPVVTQLPPELEGQMTQQRAQLRRMGAINPDAKKEYKFGIRTLFVHEHAGAGFAPGRIRPAAGDQRVG